MYQDCLLFIFYWLSLCMAQLEKKKRLCFQGRARLRRGVRQRGSSSPGWPRGRDAEDVMGVEMGLWGFGALRAPAAQETRVSAATPGPSHQPGTHGTTGSAWGVLGGPQPGAGMGCVRIPSSPPTPATSHFIFPSGF